MTSTRFETLSAKCISWVTTIIVMPPSASSRITASTSSPSSGSSAEVGSSNSITCGSSASARAMAMRCCWPPEQRDGYCCALSSSPTRRSSFMATSSASCRLRPIARSCARQMFRSTVRCGKRLKDWNTMPTARRSCSRSRRDGARPASIVTPASVTRPLVGGSSWLMQRSSVLLPDPLGPMIAITSPVCNVRSMSSSTSCVPKRLCTASSCSSAPPRPTAGGGGGGETSGIQVRWRQLSSPSAIVRRSLGRIGPVINNPGRRAAAKRGLGPSRRDPRATSTGICYYSFRRYYNFIACRHNRAQATESSVVLPPSCEECTLW